VINSWLKRAVAFFFFIAAAVYFLRPIGDVDFPWHLKPGQYIFQHGEIPKTDPFSTASTGSRAEYFLLSQYWLAQVIFYLIFSNFGPLGIVILRSLVFAGIVAILWTSMRETPLLLKTSVLSLTVMMFPTYLGERPQFFTFFLAAVILVVLEGYRKTKSLKKLFLLPPVMLIWANLHGGFIFGDVIIMIVCVSETLKYFFLKKPYPPLEGRKLLWLLAMGSLSIFVSYVNPNSSYAFTFAIEGILSPGIKSIREYISPLAETWGPFVNSTNFIYWGIVGYSLIILALNLRSLDITHLGLISFTLVLSLTAIRFVPFFLITALIISGQYRFGLTIPGKYHNLERLKPLVNMLLLITVTFGAGYLIYSHPGIRYLTTIMESRYYPERAADFLEEKVPSARIFNSYNIGSYLLFRLYPKFKVFIDTRGYNAQVASDERDITTARRWDGDTLSTVDAANELLPEDYGRIKIEGARPHLFPKEPKWQKLLRNYNIELIVLEASNVFTGELYALPLSLISNNEWKLVYYDGKAMIFVKDIPKFEGLIAEYELPKERVYDQIGMENAPKLGSFHSEVYSSLAFSILMKGGSEDRAEDFVERALHLDPKNLFATYLEALLAIRENK